MFHLKDSPQPWLFVAMLLGLAGGPAAGAVQENNASQDISRSLLPEPAGPFSGKSDAGLTTPLTAPPPGLLQAMQRGNWTRACAIAVDTLARKEANVDALGIFALCQALTGQKEATERALLRLGEAEPAPGFYGPLTQAVAHLRGGSAGQAEGELKHILDLHPDDPLATYFRGEAQHAGHKDGEAVASFKAVLKPWPDNAPSLSAIARLSVTKAAGQRALEAAIAMSERAARIEPTNRTYWEQTASLCDKAGQHERAQAIRLQWLNRPPAPK